MARFFYLIVIIIFLSACGMNKTYNITSEPKGAVVSSGDAVYGTTPFQTDLNTILPNRQWDLKPSSSRLLKFSKEGYLPGTYVITEFGEAGDIHVDLIKVDEKENSEEINLRLMKLKTLHENGLINNIDYEKKKDEILNEL